MGSREETCVVAFLVRHPVWLLVCVWALPLLVQLPANCPRKIADNGQVFGTLPFTCETQVKLLAPGSSLT